MRRTGWIHLLWLAALAMAVGLVGTTSALAADASTGPEIFTAKKCNRCHSVEAASIAKEEVADDEDDMEDEAIVPEGEKIEPPDLSGVGLDRDSAWLEKWLNKRQENEDGRKHKKKFKGKKAELDTLVEWLGTLKTKPAAEAPAAEQPAAAEPAAE